VIACDSTEGLLHRIDAKEMMVTVDVDLAAVPAALARFDPELKDGRRLVFRYPPSRTDSGQILAAVGEAGLRVVDINTREAELEDIFLSLTRRQGAAVR